MGTLEDDPFGESDPSDDLEKLLQRAKSENKPQLRAEYWGECICYVLSLEDIREKSACFDAYLYWYAG